MREKDWKRYPKDLKEKCLSQKPGIMGIQYASKCGNEFKYQIKFFTKYLEEYKKHPFITDFKYFFMIWYYIFFKGVRSS
jgi:hypothetical protein